MSLSAASCELADLLVAGVAARIDPQPDPFLADPAGWVRERPAEFFWSKQVEIADSVRANRRTAVKSCHGVGKSFSASRLICWWLDVHPPGEAFVVSTAPTFAQVRAVLWREVNKAARKVRANGHELLGKVNQTEWVLGNDLIAFGRKPSDTDPTAFQGIHARYVLVVLDEACGIPKDLWIAANALATNEDCRILAIGNPDDPASHFAEICRPDSGWNVLQISAFDSPNFTDEDVPAELRPMLVDRTWVEEMRRDVGEGSPVWIAKVTGEFPEDANDTVVRISRVKACQRPEQEHPAEALLPVELGVDVGAGGDMTVVRERRGRKAGRVWRKQTPEPVQVEEMVLEALVATGATRVKVDATGVGWGIAGRLDVLRGEGKHHAAVVRVYVGSASSRPDRFGRLRDQIWWEVGRQLSEDLAWDLSEIDDRTVADLTAPKYAIDAANRVKVEKKEETKKRLGRSPDDADALLLAFYTPAGSAEEYLSSLTPPCASCGRPSEPGKPCTHCGHVGDEAKAGGSYLDALNLVTNEDRQPTPGQAA